VTGVQTCALPIYKSGNENLYVWAIVVVNTEKEDAEYDQY